jgi:hypothetical protein
MGEFFYPSLESLERGAMGGFSEGMVRELCSECLVQDTRLEPSRNHDGELFAGGGKSPAWEGRTSRPCVGHTGDYGASAII